MSFLQDTSTPNAVCLTFDTTKAWTVDAIPPPGGVVLVHCRAEFSAWMWVELFLRAGLGGIDRLCMATYSVGRAVPPVLRNLMELGLVAQAQLLMANQWDNDSGTTANTRDVPRLLAGLAADFPDRFRWNTARNHAKTIIGYMESGDTLAVVGSGNLSDSNTRSEAYVCLNDRRAARHLSDWIGRATLPTATDD